MSLADPLRRLPSAPLAGRPWVFDDDVRHVRVWGTSRTYPLAREAAPLTLGADAACTLPLADPRGLLRPRHALIEYRGDRWVIRDLGERNAIAIDDAPCSTAVLEAGACVALGGMTLVVEGARVVALREYLRRLLGYGAQRAAVVDRALRLIRRALYHRHPLGLVALEPAPVLAAELHRRVFGTRERFVLSDPRHRSRDASVRTASNRANIEEALAAAQGGTLCLWANHLPGGFGQVLEALDVPAPPTLVVLCGRPRVPAVDALLAAIEVPALVNRGAERAQIVDEYVAEVAAELALAPPVLPEVERQWIIEELLAHGEIEKTVRRFLALHEMGSYAGAAARLGMSHPSLIAWRQRRPNAPWLASAHARPLARAVEVVAELPAPQVAADASERER